jgi:F-type H+-transporting ATPase subunit a
LVPPKKADKYGVIRRLLLYIALPIGLLAAQGSTPAWAGGGGDGDPDAIGHSADGVYLDFSPLGKVELPRIFVVREADGDIRIDLFGSTHSALEPDTVMEAGAMVVHAPSYTLSSGDAPDARYMSAVQVAEMIEEHAHMYYPVVPVAEGEQLIVDLSVTRQMVFVLIAALILLWLGLSTASRYKSGTGRDSAPRGGFQNAMEALIIFIRDEVAVPTIGKEKYKKYLPYLLSVFIFVLLGNLIGLLPWGVTATSGISVTAALAFVTFVITNVSGTKDYWRHIFNPPGVPLLIKPILIPVEFLSLFTKPITLAIRLFANMLSGHLIIVSLLGLIFIFTAKIGTAAGIGSIFIAIPMTLFIYVLKILVSIIQAYIFTMLSALYFGMAVEEHAHDDHHESEAHEPALASA